MPKSTTEIPRLNAPRLPAGPVAPAKPAPGAHWIEKTVYAFLTATGEVETRRAVPEAIRDDPDALVMVSWLASLPPKDRERLASDATYADAGSLLDDWPVIAAPGGDGIEKGLSRLMKGATAPRPLRPRRRSKATGRAA